MYLKALPLLLLVTALITVLGGCSKTEVVILPDDPYFKITPVPTTTPLPTATPNPKGEESMSIDPNKQYIATITTNKGTIEIELFAKEAPKTVNNFVTLSNKDFYNGVIFHRVIPNFMIQGGDPTGTGRGGPGYNFDDEFDPTLKFDKPGLLAMANAGPNTNGSQFFITTSPTLHLTGLHTIFGHVIQGQDVVDAISKVPASTGDRPVEDVQIQGIKIEESPRE
jgi:peptidyl-prolyl cis-trans isomerase A (cyclophilin A)